MQYVRFDGNLVSILVFSVKYRSVFNDHVFTTGAETVNQLIPALGDFSYGRYGMKFCMAKDLNQLMLISELRHI